MTDQSKKITEQKDNVPYQKKEQIKKSGRGVNNARTRLTSLTFDIFRISNIHLILIGFDAEYVLQNRINFTKVNVKDVRNREVYKIHEKIHMHGMTIYGIIFSYRIQIASIY